MKAALHREQICGGISGLPAFDLLFVRVADVHERERRTDRRTRHGPAEEVTGDCRAERAHHGRHFELHVGQTVHRADALRR
nr:hypothetical protein [Streptomyces aurantiacus]